MLFRDTTFTSFYLSFTLIHILDVNIITGNSYIGQSRDYFEAVFGSFVTIRVLVLQVGYQNIILNFGTNRYSIC